MSEIKVNTITDASGGNTTTVNGVTPNANTVRGRNLIINGAMQVAQRNTSVSSVASSGYKSLDRYQFDYSGAGTWTISQDSDTPSGFGSSMKFLCTASDALDSGSDRVAFRQFIEGQNLQGIKKGTADAQTLTASFWVKSNKTGTYIVEIYDHDNARHINKSYTVSSADTWEYKTITFEADTTGVLDNDNALSLHLHFWLAAGSTYSGGTLQTSWGGNVTPNRAAGNVNLADAVNNYFNITGIQLEVGSVATEFDHRSYGEEFAACERYYHKWVSQELYGNIAIGYSASSSNGRAVYYLPTTMRTTPSLSSGGSFRVINDGGTYGGSVSAISIQRNHTKTPFIQFTTSANNLPGSDYQPVEMGANNDADAYIDFDAEL